MKIAGLFANSYCESTIFRMYFIFAYFVRGGFRTKIKCILKFKARQKSRSGQRLYENFMRTKGQRSPAYENMVRTEYSGSTVVDMPLS